MPTQLNVPDDFALAIAILDRLGYRKGRQHLWAMKPRPALFLYKFRTLLASDSISVDRVRDVIVRSRLWFSSPEDFNDPFDMSVKVDVDGTVEEIRKRLDAIYKERGLNWIKRRRELQRIMVRKRIVLPARAQQSFDTTATSTGVCSFAGDPLSILMWSHYPANHEGLCFQFETARDPGTFLQALSVSYSLDYPMLNWVSGHKDIAAVLRRKHEGWAYEKESRILALELARQYVEFRPVALSSIIIGCRAKSDMTEQLAELLAERSSKGFPRPKIYRASKHNSKYKLVLSKDSDFQG